MITYPKISIAPMLDWTDRHDRYLLRLISKRVWLYSEMIPTGAILNGKADWMLGYNPQEQPLALQLGGSDPTDLARCAQEGEQRGYQEVNLNCGCPSERVQNGTFGVVLMRQPTKVAQCIEAMQKVVQIPVTIKCRIGVDEMDSYEEFRHFIGVIRQAGCTQCIVHARKARLNLAPKANREIPPIKYEYVYAVKKEFADMHISINGDVKTLQGVQHHLEQGMDGVMLGRAPYHNPLLLAPVDTMFYGEQPREIQAMDIMQQYIEYMDGQQNLGVALHHMTKHIMSFFNGVKGARQYRRHLSEWANKEGSGTNVVREALGFLEWD
jgi:tRNA-dihydrouridine synthase A